jgi:hypothetical protein
MLFCIAAWSCGTGLFFVASDLWVATFLSVFIYLAAAFIALAFYYFAHYFPYSLKPMTAVHNYGNLVAAMLVSIVVAYFKVEIVFGGQSGQGYISTISPVPYFLFALYFLFYIVASFYILYQKYQIATSTHRNILKVVFFSTLLAAFFGSVFNLLLPIYTYDYIWVGPLFTLVMVFIIIKYIFLIED